ncbi:hypothetical protein [Streptococcus sp. X13SY08]|nr:hypothetical protein [Streptococcus sp. X13SY08]
MPKAKIAAPSSIRKIFFKCIMLTFLQVSVPIVTNFQRELKDDFSG